MASLALTSAWCTLRWSRSACHLRGVATAGILEPRRTSALAPRRTEAASWASTKRWSSTGGTPAADSGLKGLVDRFGGVTVTLAASDVADVATFRGRLRAALAEWRTAGRCAVWAQVPNAAAAALPTLLEEGFDWHHAKPSEGNRAGGGYALLALWLAEGSSRLPLYASTQVGVGGLVFNDDGEVLLMQERVSLTDQIHGLWKLPGGLTDPGEDLVAAAVREVREETGVDARPEGLLCMHHRHGYRHGVSDMYFTVRMRAESAELKPDWSETQAVTWMPLEVAQSSPQVMVFNRRILSLAHCPLLLPHYGRHGSGTAKNDFYVYAATPDLEPITPATT